MRKWLAFKIIALIVNRLYPDWTGQLERKLLAVEDGLFCAAEADTTSSGVYGTQFLTNIGLLVEQVEADLHWKTFDGTKPPPF